MSEYIERASAYQLAKKICDAIDSDEFQRLNFGMRILDWIDDIPAADVRPVVRGKWISGDARNVTAVCSNCGRLRLGNGAESATKYAPFCEKCGAYMREES